MIFLQHVGYLEFNNTKRNEIIRNLLGMLRLLIQLQNFTHIRTSNIITINNKIPQLLISNMHELSYRTARRTVLKLVDAVNAKSVIHSVFRQIPLLLLHSMIAHL